MQSIVSSLEGMVEALCLTGEDDESEGWKVFVSQYIKELEKAN